MSCIKFFREALSDENGQGDIAYLSIGALTGAAIGGLMFICTMAAIAYFRCVPLVTKDVVVNCTFDPLPMGQAAGLIFGAFSALIGALAGYMVATRRQSRAPDQVVNATTATVAQIAPAALPAEASTDVGATIGPARKGKR